MKQLACSIPLSKNNNWAKPGTVANRDRSEHEKILNPLNSETETVENSEINKHFGSGFAG